METGDVVEGLFTTKQKREMKPILQWQQTQMEAGP